MSDSINQEQLRAKEILEHKTRVAVNMDKVKNDSITDYYSMENTQADILFIEQVLAQEELKQLTDDQYRSLRTVQGRNISHRLLNQQKFLGDSKAMTKVKESIRYLESLLDQKDMNKASLDEVESAFIKAMKSCDDYTSSKNPWFSTGQKRKEMVISQSAQLLEEYNLFRIGREAQKSKLGQHQTVSAMDLITLGRERRATINSTMDEYHRHFDTALSKGEAVYDDLYKGNENLNKTQKPVLSPALSAQLDLALYRDQDIYNAVENAQNDFKNENAPYIKRGKFYMSDYYKEYLKEVYEAISQTSSKDESADDLYKKMLNAAFNKLQDCIQAADAITFIKNKITSQKEHIHTDDDDKVALNKLVNYYAGVLVANEMRGSKYKRLIQKITRMEALSSSDIALFGDAISEKELSRYEFIRDPKEKEVAKNTKKQEEAKTKSTDDIGSQTESNKLFDSLLTQDNVEKGNKLQQEKTDRLEREAAEEQKRKDAELFEQKKAQREWETRVENRRYSIAYDRRVPDMKKYELQKRFYEEKLQKQKQYIEWYEKHHNEPKIIRQVIARDEKVREKFSKLTTNTHGLSGEKAFYKDIDKYLDSKACTAFKKELDEILSEGKYSAYDLEEVLDGGGKASLAEKVEDLLIKHRPKIMAPLVAKLRHDAEEDIEDEQKHGIPRPLDMYMSVDFRAFRMNKLNSAINSYTTRLKEYKAGTVVLSSMQSNAADLYRKLLDFAENNEAMEREEKEKYRKILRENEPKFSFVGKWPDMDGNINFLQKMFNELQPFIQRENEIVDAKMCYRLMEDDEKLYDERMQDYLFRKECHADGVGLRAIMPTLKYPGVDRIQAPSEPNINNYMPSVEEVEKILREEDAQKSK